MRAWMRASSSFSSCFFLRRASRAAFWAVRVEEVEAEEAEGWGLGEVALAFPFALADGGFGEDGGWVLVVGWVSD